MDISINQSEVAHTSCNNCWTSKDLNGKHLRIGSFLVSLLFKFLKVKVSTGYFKSTEATIRDF